MKKMHRSLSTLVVLGLVAIPSTAWAQGANCPPDSWFCADTQQPDPDEGGTLQPLPQQTPAPTPTPAQPKQPPAVVYQQAPPAPPPVIIYQPAPPPVMVVQPAQAPPAYVYTPAKQKYRREWGVNLRLEGAFFGKGFAGDAGMGGIGTGLRYRMTPYFALQSDFDFLSGRDYQGFKRQEFLFSVNTLFFLNPKSQVQFYFLAGLGGGIANVERTNALTSEDVQWGYVAGQAGGGIEFRITKHFAMHVDVRGFLRTRVDSEKDRQPEFIDPATGKTSNASGGGLVTAGMTFYF